MKLTVVYASDANYVKLTAISAVSLLKHNPSARIVLLGYNLKKEFQNLVRSCVVSHGGEFQYLDVSGALGKLQESGCSTYASYAVYARVFIPELLNESGKVVYLDSDTLVNDSIAEILQTSMDGKSLAFGIDCTPCSYKKFVKVPRSQLYYNSGVMVIDLDRWRAHSCTERFLAELNNPSGPLVLTDQDVFVRSMPEEIALLPPKWNFISHYFIFNYEGVKRVVGGCIGFSKDEYLDAQRDPRIFHFLGYTLGRPWYTSSKHPIREAYRRAAAEAGFPDVVEQVRDMGLDYKVQYLLHRILPHPLFDIICNLLYRINIWRMYHV